jgi:hypothetical protein
VEGRVAPVVLLRMASSADLKLGSGSEEMIQQENLVEMLVEFVEGHYQLNSKRNSFTPYGSRQILPGRVPMIRLRPIRAVELVQESKSLITFRIF